MQAEKGIDQLSPRPAWDRLWSLVSGLGARGVLRTGFALILGLLVFSTIRAYQIQSTLSDEALEVYHRHIRQDELLVRLRRTLWLGGNAARDFLLDPSSDREAKYAERLGRLQSENLQYLEELEHLPAPGNDRADFRGLKATLSEFWSTLGSLPASAAKLNPAQRYQFLQDQIVTRRSTASDGIRELAQIMQQGLQEDELEFARTRREGAERLLWLLAFSLVLALLVAGITMARLRRLEQQSRSQYEEVLRAKADLQLLSARLMQVQEEERTSLSRELHDEVGQTLATLRLEIRRAEALPARRMPEIRERLARACELADRTIQVVRDTSRLLRPALLDDLGLSPALQWLVEDFTRRNGIPCELAERDFPDTLSDAIRTCVFRVVQEALHNCEKHAAATRIALRIEQTPARLTVSIQDDGGGFEAAAGASPAPAEHFGIFGMRERAMALGGSLEVSSSPRNGTRVTLTLPVEQAPPPAIRISLEPLGEKA